MKNTPVVGMLSAVASSEGWGLYIAYTLGFVILLETPYWINCMLGSNVTCKYLVFAKPVFGVMVFKCGTHRALRKQATQQSFIITIVEHIYFTTYRVIYRNVSISQFLLWDDSIWYTIYTSWQIMQHTDGLDKWHSLDWCPAHSEYLNHWQ